MFPSCNGILERLQVTFNVKFCAVDITKKEAGNLLGDVSIKPVKGK